MKLYNGYSPNGLRVSAFLKEKAIDLSVVAVDIMKGETRTPEFEAMNSLCQVPVLELEDGEILTETMAICRYLEALHPNVPLFGSNPLEAARIEMWTRRIELNIFSVPAQIGLHEIPYFSTVIEQLPAYAETQRRLLPNRLSWLNGELDDGRPYIAGDNFSVADITGMAALMIFDFMDIETPPELHHFTAWASKMRTRPSYSYG